jgi:hypothetical protein
MKVFDAIKAPFQKLSRKERFDEPLTFPADSVFIEGHRRGTRLKEGRLSAMERGSFSTTYVGSPNMAHEVKLRNGLSLRHDGDRKGLHITDAHGHEKTVELASLKVFPNSVEICSTQMRQTIHGDGSYVVESLKEPGRKLTVTADGNATATTPLRESTVCAPVENTDNDTFIVYWSKALIGAPIERYRPFVSAADINGQGG